MVKRILLVTATMALICALFIVTLAGQETYSVNLREHYISTDDINVAPEGKGVIELTGWSVNDGILTLKVKALNRGHEYIDVTGNGSQPMGSVMIKYYVHPGGIITIDDFFGYNSASRYIPVAVFIIIGYTIGELIRKYRNDLKHNLYSYRNLMELGLIVFLSFMALSQIRFIFRYKGLIDTIEGLINLGHIFSYIVLPAAFVTGIVVTVSNIRLVKREGRNWRNMLGLLLGVFFIVMTLLPGIISDILQHSTIIDVHGQQKFGFYLDLFVENSIALTVTYLECILMATVISAWRAAKRVPDFDRDFMIILGSQINDDGTLTKLLQGRADRAIEFARMQKQATGKDLVFIGSGGQGEDEVIAEGKAIAGYLAGQGIPPERIIAEDRSLNTEQNFRYSLELIGKTGISEPKIGFSTTNYHVYRSGVLANRVGSDIQGIGASTRSYFWINAFIREYIATLSEERKVHITMILILTVLLIAVLLIYYLSFIL